MGTIMLSDVSASDLSAFIDSIKGGLTDFTSGNLGTILVAGLGVSVTLVLAWFAYRWVVKKVSGAMKKGKL